MKLLPRSPVEDSPLARAFAWLGFAVACAAIAVYGQSYVLPPLALILAAAGHLFSYRHRHRKRGVTLQALIAGLLFACVAYFVLDSTVAVFGGSLPQANFVMLLVAVTSFDLTTRRNLYSSLWMSLALLYLAAVFAWDVTFTGIGIAWALCLAGFWAASHLQRLEPRTLRVPTRPAALALIGALVAGSAAFWLLPQPQASPSGPLVISLPREVPMRGEVENPSLPLVEFGSGGAGASDSVDLRYRGRLGSDVVMYIRTGAPAYWRGLVFDTYRGGAWTASLAGVRRTYHPYVDRRDLPAPLGPQLGSFVQTVRVVRSMPGVIYAAQPLESLYYPGAGLEEDLYGDWYAPAPHRAGTVYSVVSHLPDYTPASLEASASSDEGDPDPEVWKAYYDGSTLSNRARVLAATFVSGVPPADRYQVVMALTRALQRNYAYSLQVGHVPAGLDPVDWFLFDTKVGYCEQFATAETLMLRSLGIPARLATGYAPGSYDPQLDQAVVRERDAHAWVEVWFRGHGWVPVDPSPGFSALAATRFPDRFQASAIAHLIPHLTLGAPGAAAGSVGAAALLPGLLALFAGFVVLVFWLARGLPRRAPGELELLRLYARLQRRLGRRRAASETPLEYQSRVAAGQLASALGEVTRAVNRGAYAGRWPTPDEMSRLRSQLR